MKHKNLYEPPEVKILYFENVYTDLILSSATPDDSSPPSQEDTDGSWIIF